MDGGGGQRQKRLSNSCILLIVIAGMERFAFKGVASNLVTYLTDVVKMTNSSAAKTVNSWCGLTSMLPLLVAPLADSYWGRFSTILASSFLYVVGLAAVTSTALTWTSSTQNDIISSTLILFGSLCLISLGQGGFNPSLQAFGADELENDNDEELPTSKFDIKTTKKSMFFTWWYFGVCSGSLLGVIVMAYIQDTFGWVLGFAIPTIAMVLSVVFFVFGIPIYQTRILGFKSVPGIARIIKAIRFRFMEGRITLSNDDDSNEIELELQKKPLCDHQSNLDRINPKTEANMLKNSKVLLRLLPIWTMLLMFAVIFQQPATFFTKQGMTMKRNIGDNFKIPPATLQSAITLSIILLMPLYNKVLIPTTRAITRQENGIDVMQRMGIGMFLSIVAMVVAAMVETKRLKLVIIATREARILEPETAVVVDLSIFWLLPQYVLLGVSDIFTVVGMQEFFYNEVPDRMRTMGFALYTSVFGVGSFLSALLISVVEVFSSSGGVGDDGGRSWFSDDMSEARLDKYYWLLAMGSLLSLVIYVILCKFYKSMSDLNNESSE